MVGLLRDSLKQLARAAMACALTSGFITAADQVRCPARVEVRQQITAPVPGWLTSLEDMPHSLAGITFFDGKPSEKASLAPDSETKVKGNIVSTWTFNA